MMINTSFGRGNGICTAAINGDKGRLIARAHTQMSCHVVALPFAVAPIRSLTVFMISST